ncbi:hypothetical protein SAMN05443637_117116 [Pseudonocardia thermophila]|jgi:Uncharacterized conserved protein|uniref:Carbon monoxide dehydrogenase subunit G n=1 Tax=Pseudonocardia thermophila TaxID=1848 RepID=A0A1M6XNR3_PSETH|nr:SRPBCC domain-containing protein [Pseudonocardia thermophila]SHL07652.1 hypothetical protein SAMN05443637_117116 [Pseudonocardia thermophila]
MSETTTVEDRIDLELDPAALFAVLRDLDQVAPCVPGASLDPRAPDDGGVRTGEVVFAFGPIRYRYRGTMTVKELVEADRRITYQAAASETSGEGDLSADLTLAALERGSGGSTLVVKCDVALTGMVADFAAGMVGDVAHDIFQQFGKAVKARYADGDAATVDAGEPPAGQYRAAEAAGAAPPPAAPRAIGAFGMVLRITRARLGRLVRGIFGRAGRAVR